MSDVEVTTLQIVQVESEQLESLAVLHSYHRIRELNKYHCILPQAWVLGFTNTYHPAPSELKLS